MAIRKLEYYQGAALCQLIRSAGKAMVQVDNDAIVLDDWLRVYIKFCTKTTSPWSFTFSSSEATSIRSHVAKTPTMIALVCGADGIAGLQGQDWTALSAGTERMFAINCHRRHNEHYTVSGPGGMLLKKIAPSAWKKALVSRE